VNTYSPSREDAMALGGGLLLFIGLLAFPWYSVGGFTLVATDSPYSIWGVLALICVIVILLDLVLARFAPQVQIPTTQVGRDMTRLGVCALLVLFLLIKFIDHVGDFGWGFYFDIILLVIAVAGCWLIAQGKSTPIMTAPGGGPRI